MQDLLALVVSSEGSDAKLGGEREDSVLARPGPLPAHLDNLAVTEILVHHPPADPVPGLEHQHGTACRCHGARRRQPGQPGPDYQDVR